MKCKDNPEARNRLGLTKTKMQKHTKESILPGICAIKHEYPNMGARSLTKALQLEFGICVPECVFWI